MDNKKTMDVSIIIPAYNEEKRLGKTLEKIYSYFKDKGINFEIIVVDDGSRDGTVNLVKNFSIDHPEVKLRCHPHNKGKGAAVKTGVLTAEGNVILFTDADLSTPIEEFEKLKDAIDRGYDIAIGSRGIESSKVILPQPWYRRYIGKIFPYLVRIIIMADIKDTQCGFKLFKKNAGIKLFKELKAEGFAFDVEILARGKKEHLKIAEIGVLWYNSPESKVSMLKSPLKMLLELNKIKRVLK